MWTREAGHYKHSFDLRAIMASVDPALLGELHAAEKHPRLIAATLTIQPNLPTESDARSFDEWVNGLVRRAEAEAKSSAAEVVPYEFLGSFSIVAVPAVLLALLRQPEIASAMSDQPGGESIKPPDVFRRHSVA